MVCRHLLALAAGCLLMLDAAVADKECRVSVKDLTGLAMYDATGKSTNDLGQYDICQNLPGIHHCLAQWSNGIQLGICAPEECGPEDMTNSSTGMPLYIYTSAPIFSLPKLPSLEDATFHCGDNREPWTPAGVWTLVSLVLLVMVVLAGGLLEMAVIRGSLDHCERRDRGHRHPHAKRKRRRKQAPADLLLQSNGDTSDGGAALLEASSGASAAWRTDSPNGSAQPTTATSATTDVPPSLPNGIRHRSGEVPSQARSVSRQASGGQRGGSGGGSGRKSARAPYLNRRFPLWLRIFLAFSFYNNVQRMVGCKSSQPGPQRDFAALNGVRVMSMFLVILGHSAMATVLGGLTVSNFAAILPPTGMLASWKFQVVISAEFAVDAFFFISGFLTAQALVTRARKMFQVDDQGRDLVGERRPNRLLTGLGICGVAIVHRVLRLLPTIIGATILIMHLLPYLGEGPYWHGVQSVLLDNCRDYWWTNFLFVNVYIPWVGNGRHECMPWLWYLADDLVFFIALTPFILLYAVRPKLSVWILASLLLASQVAGTIVVGVLELNGNGLVNVLYPQKHSYADIYYSKPWFRVPPYIVGIFLAFIWLSAKDIGAKGQPARLASATLPTPRPSGERPPSTRAQVPASGGSEALVARTGPQQDAFELASPARRVGSSGHDRQVSTASAPGAPQEFQYHALAEPEHGRLAGAGASGAAGGSCQDDSALQVSDRALSPTVEPSPLQRLMSAPQVAETLSFYQRIFAPRTMPNNAATALVAFAGVVITYLFYDIQSQYPNPAAGYDGWSQAYTTFYTAWSRLIFTIALAAICYVAFARKGWLVHHVLNWPVLEPLARLTFGAYIYHVPVMVLIYFQQHAVMAFTPNTLAVHFVFFYVMAHVVGGCMFVLVEKPCMNLEAMLMAGAERSSRKGDKGKQVEDPLAAGGVDHRRLLSDSAAPAAAAAAALPVDGAAATKLPARPTASIQ